MPKIVDDFKLFAATALRRVEDPAAEEAAAVLQGLAGQFDSKLSAIEADDHLSQQGKVAARVAAQADLQKAVDRWRAEVVTPIDATIDGQQLALAAAAAPPRVSELEAVRREILHGEIRRSVEHIDPLVLRGSFDELPSQVREALKDAPPRPVATDAGPIAWVQIAPTPAELTSPELESARALRDGLGGLADQLVVLAAGNRQQARVEGRAA